MRPTPEQTLVIEMVSEARDITELPEDSSEWITYGEAERKARRGRGLRIITLDSDDERQARKVLSA
jgi:hypothetical protein